MSHRLTSLVISVPSSERSSWPSRPRGGGVELQISRGGWLGGWLVDWLVGWLDDYDSMMI